MVEKYPSCKKWLEDHGRQDVIEKAKERLKLE